MNPDYLSLTDEDGETALHYAAKNGHKDLALALINKMNPDDLSLTDNYVQTALHVAAINGNTAIVLALLDKMDTKDLSLRDEHGETALHYAAKNGHIKIVLALLDKMDTKERQKLLFRDAHGNRALDIIIENKNTEIEKLILGKIYGLTDLHQAVLDNNADEVSKLIKGMSKKDLNKKSNMGNTALQIAQSKGFDNIAHILLQADFVKNPSREIALDLAKKNTEKAFQLVEESESARASKNAESEKSLKDENAQKALERAENYERASASQKGEISKNEGPGVSPDYNCEVGAEEVLLALIDRMDPEERKKLLLQYNTDNSPKAPPDIAKKKTKAILEMDPEERKKLLKKYIDNPNKKIELDLQKKR